MIIETEQLDGSIKRVTQQQKANGEIFERTLIKQRKEVKELNQEYVQLGKTIRETKNYAGTPDSGDFLGSKETQEISAGLNANLNKNSYGEVVSSSITDTRNKLGELIGTYNELKGVKITDEALSKRLSDVYKENEIREISLDRVTGKYTVTLKENEKQNRVIKGTYDSVTGSIYKQSDALKQVTARNLGWTEQMKIALSRVPIWLGATTVYFQAFPHL